MDGRRLAGAFIAGILLLTACGGSSGESSDSAASSKPDDPTASEPSETPEPAAPVGGPGTYQFEYAGARGDIEVPAVATDPRLSEVEAYREETGAEEVGYIVADVDNTAGTEDINMYQVVVITEDGEQVEANGVDSVIGEWRGLLSSGDTDGYNRGVELSNSLATFIRPGAKGSALLVTSEPVTSVSRVYVYPAGGLNQIEASRAP